MTANAMTTAADTSTAPRAEWQLVGLLGVVVVTVAFWTALASLVGTWLGAPLSGSTLMAVAGGIGLFLTFTLSPIMFRGEMK